MLMRSRCSAVTTCSMRRLRTGCAGPPAFRNVLEHEYVAVDDQIVLARPNDPSDLEQFSGQVARWLGQ
jgi:hypothetical protein